MAQHPPRDVQTVPIAADTLALRCRSWQRLRFELEYALERGTTANSYLIQAEKIALIDPPGETFATLFFAELRRHVALTQIDYVILGHINPNRVVTLAQFCWWGATVGWPYSQGYWLGSPVGEAGESGSGTNA